MSEPEIDGQSPDEEAQHQPRFQSDGFDCPRCGLWAHQEWSQLWARPAGSFTGVESQVDPRSGESSEMWWRSHCARCTKPSIWRGEQLVYPLTSVGGKPHKDMPADVRELYEEAAAVAAVSRRAGAALARATVERLIKHLDTDANSHASLNARIERLESNVSSDLRTMLHIVRETGNQALHEKDQPGELAVMVLDDVEGPELLEYLLRTTNDLVEELITRPATTKAFREMLPEWVRKRLGDE